MPFIYRGKVANIDRSKRRSDDFIHENISKAIDQIFRSSGSKYIQIVPISINDPPFDHADPKKFLALCATKVMGLSLYEVEHWLDVVRRTNVYRYYLDTGTLVDVDERRKWYRGKIGSSESPSNCLVYRP